MVTEAQRAENFKGGKKKKKDLTGSSFEKLNVRAFLSSAQTISSLAQSSAGDVQSWPG